MLSINKITLNKGLLIIQIKNSFFLFYLKSYLYKIYKQLMIFVDNFFTE
jgi:hypothetical protein